MTREICRRLKYSTELTEHVADVVNHHMMFMDVMKMKPSSLKRFLSRPNSSLDLDLHRADSLASHGDLEAYHYCVEQRRRMAVEHGDELLPPPLVNGADLIELGLKPGPEFKEILDEVRDEQLEGRIHTREDALEVIKRRRNGKQGS